MIAGHRSPLYVVGVGGPEDAFERLMHEAAAARTGGLPRQGIEEALGWQYLADAGIDPPVRAEEAARDLGDIIAWARDYAIARGRLPTEEDVVDQASLTGVSATRTAEHFGFDGDMREYRAWLIERIVQLLSALRRDWDWLD